MRLRQVRKQYSKWKKKAVTLQKWALDTFESEKKHKLFVDKAFEGINLIQEDWLDKIVGIAEEHE